MPTTPGHDAVIRFVEETTPGTTPTNPALLLFSPEVQNIKWGLDRNQKESRDVGSIDVHEYYALQNAYKVEVEFHAYDWDRLWDFFTRETDGTVRPYTLEIIPNKSAGAGNVVYFRGRGWKPNSVNLKGDVDNAYMLTISFEGGLWAAPVTTDPGIGTGSREDATAFSGQTIALFSDGAITLDGAAWAVLLGSLDLTVEHGVKVHRNTGNKDPKVDVSVSGPRTIKGSCDISMDAGFKTQWDKVVAGASHEIIIPFGIAGSPKLTLGGVYFPSIDAEVAVDTDLLMGGQPFTATTLTPGTV